jgi:hypothetical protein
MLLLTTPFAPESQSKPLFLVGLWLIVDTVDVGPYTIVDPCVFAVAAAVVAEAIDALRKLMRQLTTPHVSLTMQFPCTFTFDSCCCCQATTTVLLLMLL